jgi:hypothetical protein
MAQAKRKRRSKHRGTAAGAIETRGRTGRPPSPEERKQQERASARERRLNKPPTWKGSAMRGGLAASVMFAFILITTRGKDKVAAAVIFAIFAFMLYVVAGYWLESYLYKRRQRKKLEAR